MRQPGILSSASLGLLNIYGQNASAETILADLRVRERRKADKARRLRALALQAYHAARNPLEAKMAGVLMDMFMPGEQLDR